MNPANNLLEPTIALGMFILTLFACLVVAVVIGTIVGLSELNAAELEDEASGGGSGFSYPVEPDPLTPTPMAMLALPAPAAEPTLAEQRRLMSDMARREWYPTLDRIEAQRLAQAGSAQCFAFENTRGDRRFFAPTNLN